MKVKSERDLKDKSCVLAFVIKGAS